MKKSCGSKFIPQIACTRPHRYSVVADYMGAICVFNHVAPTAQAKMRDVRRVQCGTAKWRVQRPYAVPY